MEDKSQEIEEMNRKAEENSSSSSTTERWFDDNCILDMDYFIKTLSGIKSKGVRPDLLGSIITHYAFKCLPELSTSTTTTTTTVQSHQQSHSATATWMKKRFVVETLVGLLPPEKNAVTCGFLLKLLRTASMVGAEYGVRMELEKKAARQLDEASLGDLMIPSFAHTCETILDVSMVFRIVKRYADGIEEGEEGVVKVAKVVDSYLAEAAVDANLGVMEFVALASSLPTNARSLDDGLYRAIDTYLKAHPKLAKQERKSLCRLIDSRKLSADAAIHAAHNERLPVRAVIQVLFSNSMPSLTPADWSGSFTATRRQDAEVRRLRDDLLRLEARFQVMQARMETLISALNNNKKKKKVKQEPAMLSSLFRWKKFGFVPSSFKSTSTATTTATTHNKNMGQDDVFGRQTPTNINMKTRLVKDSQPNWRRSMS